MARFHPAYVEHERKRFMRPDAHRFVRPDWQRYVQPRSELAAHYADIEQKYRPDQARVPAGSPEGGQWTEEGGREAVRIFTAGGLPRIPRSRPPSSSERTALAKAVAIALAEVGISDAAEAIAKTSWLYHAVPYISSYLDAPKSLAELQTDLTPKLGYDDHHIVEQTAAIDAGYSRSRVDAPDNRARIPRMKHWEINSWYQTKNVEFGKMSPRDYLVGKDWDERRRVGLIALKKFGVLKP